MKPRGYSLIGLVVAVVLGTRVGPSGSSRVQQRPDVAVMSLDVRANSELAQTQTGVANIDVDAGSVHMHADVPAKNTLPGIWKELCKLNPEYGTVPYYSDPQREAVVGGYEVPECLKENKPDIKALLAAVPDPVHTNLALTFDRTIAALQAAAGEQQYFPSGHFFPWSSDESNAQGGVRSSSQTSGSAMTKWGGLNNEDYPGVLIFRKSGEYSEYMVIFLVPDSPTSGLDKKIFFRAETFASEIAQIDTHVVQFIGPMFSGSVRSLKDIDTQLKTEAPDKCIDSISGTVTKAPPLFPERSGEEGCSCANADPDNSQTCDPSISTLHLLQTPDCVAIGAFIKEAGKLYGYQRDQIALVSEDGTEYGDQLQPTPDKNNPGCGAAQSDPVLLLHFPRRIAQVRNAYGKMGLGRAKPAEAPLSISR